MWRGVGVEAENRRRCISVPIVRCGEKMVIRVGWKGFDSSRGQPRLACTKNMEPHPKVLPQMLMINQK